MNKRTEHDEQVALIQWAQYHPIASKCLVAIPNGGMRNLLVAKKLKKEGVRAGVSDLFLAYPSNQKHGLWIEMKSKNGTLSDPQKSWITLMRGVGYACAVCYGFEDAVKVVEGYLNETLI